MSLFEVGDLVVIKNKYNDGIFKHEHYSRFPAGLVLGVNHFYNSINVLWLWRLRHQKYACSENAKIIFEYWDVYRGGIKIN